MLIQIVLTTILTVLIHGTETFNYAIRLAGIRISKLAVALSLNNIIILGARMSNLAQSPLTGNLVDSAKTGQNDNLLLQLQVVLSGSTIGILIAVVLFPTLTRFGENMISNFETSSGSMVKTITGTLRWSNLRQIEFKLPNLKLVSMAKVKQYKGLIIINIIYSGIFTISVLSAQYASYLVPEYSTMATSSGGLINGIAIIAAAMFHDPKMALISDRVMAGKEDRSEINIVYALMTVARLLGTFLAQFLLSPAAHVIALFCKVVSSMF